MNAITPRTRNIALTGLLADGAMYLPGNAGGPVSVVPHPS
jgi:hypothetical protein